MSLKPVITEKATKLAELAPAVYAFHAGTMTKPEIIKWVKKEYKVTPVKVAIITLPGKRKALVYLKKGDKIALA